MDAGIRRRIGDIYEGSEASIVALEKYGQTRDELLRMQDWSFSRRTVSLTLLKGPPPGGGYSQIQPWTTLYPLPGFLYEYSYPSDCLDVRAIMVPPGLMPDGDPVPQLFRIDNDPVPNVVDNVASGPPAKVILCNASYALAVYRAQITDMTTWEPLFTKTLVANLAKVFEMAFDEDGNVVQRGDVMAANAQAVGGAVRG